MSAAPSAPLTAITFDFWNTLIEADPKGALERRKHAWHDVARARAIPVEPEVLDAVLDHVSAQHHEGWTSGVQYTADHALAAAGELLGSVLGPDDLDALRDAWMAASRRPDLGRLTPHCGAVVAELANRGIRLGIVCDVGLTPSGLLRDLLDAHGVLGHFSHWSFSDEVGVYKPDSAIFEHTLTGLGAAPHEALHIGDIRRTDVHGARSAGLHAVRYRGIADDDDESVEDAPHVIDDFHDLLQIVEHLAP